MAALSALNMALSSVILGTFVKYAFVETDLAPNKLTAGQKQKHINQDRKAGRIKIVCAGPAGGYP